MQGVIMANPTTMCVSSSIHPHNWNSMSRNCFPETFGNPLKIRNPKGHSSSLTSSSPSNPHFSPQKITRRHLHFSLKASSSVGSAQYTEEPTTKEKFQTSLTLPGCSSSLSLYGTGYREKVFAIIGVKVYAAGFYLNESILRGLSAGNGSSLSKDPTLFNSIFQAPLEKSLQIILVRDIDGKTFWDALDEAISPRIKAPSSLDDIALSTFRSIFEGRSLKKGTYIFLTWLDPSKMLVFVSSEGLPTNADATIESPNVTSALFDVFFGNTPVSPSLKSSVMGQLATILK